MCALFVVVQQTPARAWAEDTGRGGFAGEVSTSAAGNAATVDASHGSGGSSGASPGGVSSESNGSAEGQPVAPRDPICTVNPDGSPTGWCYYPGEGGSRRIVRPDGSAVDVQGTAARAAASLSVPSPVVRVGPDPAWNKWNALAVGLPVWVWADSQDPVSTSVTEQGIQIDMTASRGTVSVDWGDGTVTTCYSMTPRPINIQPMTKSPDCGHVYQKRGDYTITVTASWQVSWAALGQAGQVGLESSGGYDLRVSEFESVVVG